MSRRFVIELTPELRRAVRRANAIHRICSPLRRIPIVGGVAFVFWAALLENGPADLKPRWGALTFAYLNDGFRPTLWHTWQTMLDYHGEYSGIWTDGAPRNRAHAERKLARYREQPA